MGTFQARAKSDPNSVICNNYLSRFLSELFLGGFVACTKGPISGSGRNVDNFICLKRCFKPDKCSHKQLIDYPNWLSPASPKSRRCHGRIRSSFLKIIQAFFNLSYMQCIFGILAQSSSLALQILIKTTKPVSQCNLGSCTWRTRPTRARRVRTPGLLPSSFPRWLTGSCERETVPARFLESRAQQGQICETGHNTFAFYGQPGNLTFTVGSTVNDGLRRKTISHTCRAEQILVK